MFRYNRFIVGNSMSISLYLSTLPNHSNITIPEKKIQFSGSLTSLIKDVSSDANPPLDQMVFKKLVASIYSFIGQRRQLLRIKDTASCEANALDVADNVKGSELPSHGGSNSADPLDDEGEFCCICLSRLKGGENMRALPCMHKFHRNCIERWFNLCRKTCPVCRLTVGKEERSYKREEQLTEEMLIWFSSFHVAGF